MSLCGKPTFIERIVSFLPGTYTLKCLIFSCICGVPLLLLTRFLDTLNMQTAVSVFGPLTWQNVATFSFANFVLLFYALYGVSYMRRRLDFSISQAEFELPKTQSKDLHDIFVPVCKLAPALIVAFLLVAASLASFPDQFIQHSSGPISLALILVTFPFVYLAYGTFIWVYSSSIKCLHDLGRQPLKLAEFYEDAHLGVKPIGSLSLSLALVYFAGLGLVFFSFITIPLPLEFAVGTMILVGIALFFLPLNTLHIKMKNQKRLERERLKTRYLPLIASSDESTQTFGTDARKNLGHVLAGDIVDRHVDSIPVWPFDTRTLTWLSAMVLTVVAGLITKYVTILLGT